MNRLLPIHRSAICIILMLLILIPPIVYAQEENVGLLRVAIFHTPKQVAPNSEFLVNLDVEYAIHGPQSATIRSAVYSGQINEPQSNPLWQSAIINVTGGGDMTWNLTLKAPPNEGVMQLTAFAYYLNGDTWQFYNDSMQGPGFDQTSVKVASAANLEVDLGEAGLQVTVANSTQQTAISGTATIMLPVDETYSLTVPSEVELKNSTRLIFTGWNDGDNNTERSILLDGDTRLVGNYRHQYLLQVTSPVSAYSFSKWYDAGSNATLSANSTVPFSTPLNLLGLKYVFQGWTGDLNSKLNQANVTMDSGKTIEANYSVDYTPLSLPAILIVGIVGTAILLMLRRKRSGIARSTEPSETETTERETAERVPEEVEAIDSLLCETCGKSVEKEWKHCIHCGADLPSSRPVNQ